MHPSAGAVLVGARLPLVAWNVWLPEGSLTEARAQREATLADKARVAQELSGEDALGEHADASSALVEREVVHDADGGDSGQRPQPVHLLREVQSGDHVVSALSLSPAMHVGHAKRPCGGGR